MAEDRITIWHNPRCSTSRRVLAMIEAAGHAPDIRLYLTDPPSRDELAWAIAHSGRPAADFLRWKEAEVPAGLTRDADPGAILDALAAQPKLIERPVVIRGARVRLGRPPEDAADLL